MFRVLIPVDGSPCSDRAVAQLVAHSAWFREAPEIHLLHVHAPIPVGRIQQHVDHETLAAYYREESDAHLASAEALLKDAGLGYRRHIHVGAAPEIIVKLARELSCDLVTMGTQGRGALAAAIMGSVASKVLHLIDRPLLFVK